LSTKLAALRKQLAQNDMFGISPFQQRLFFMGRELKNGGRALSAIGLGPFDHHVIHLHVRPMTAAAASITREEIEQPFPKRRRIHLPSRVEAHPTRRQFASTNTNRTVPNQDVVELLEVDSESEDENNYEAEVVSQGNNNKGQGNDSVFNQGDGKGKCIQLLDSDSDEDEDVLDSPFEFDIEEDEEEEDDDDAPEQDAANNTTDDNEIKNNPNQRGMFEIL
jgi:hypothetical protein